MSTAEQPDPLAPWAFRAALSGLPEHEMRALLEGDRFPEPPEADWADEVDAIDLDGSGDVVVFQSDDEEAWVQSDTHSDLSESR